MFSIDILPWCRSFFGNLPDNREQAHRSSTHQTWPVTQRKRRYAVVCVIISDIPFPHYIRFLQSVFRSRAHPALGIFQAMLNRFLQMKRDQAAGPRERRPFVASEVSPVAWQQNHSAAAVPNCRRVREVANSNRSRNQQKSRANSER